MEEVKTSLDYKTDMGDSTLAKNVNGEIAFTKAFNEYHERKEAGLSSFAEREFAKAKESILNDVGYGGGFGMRVRASSSQTKMEAFETICEFLKDNFTEEKYPNITNWSGEQIFGYLKKEDVIPQQFNYSPALKREDLTDMFTASKQNKVFELQRRINNYDGCTTLEHDRIHIKAIPENKHGYYAGAFLGGEYNAEYAEEMVLNQVLFENPAKILHAIFHENTHKHQLDCKNNHKLGNEVYVNYEPPSLKEQLKKSDDGYIKNIEPNKEYEYRLQYMERMANLNAERLLTIAAGITKNKAMEDEIKRQRELTSKALEEMKKDDYIKKQGAKNMDEALNKKHDSIIKEKQPQKAPARLSGFIGLKRE